MGKKKRAKKAAAKLPAKKTTKKQRTASGQQSFLAAVFAVFQTAVI
jgi:hypothetical protein